MKTRPERAACREDVAELLTRHPPHEKSAQYRRHHADHDIAQIEFRHRQGQAWCVLALVIVPVHGIRYIGWNRLGRWACARREAVSLLNRPSRLQTCRHSRSRTRRDLNRCRPDLVARGLDSQTLRTRCDIRQQQRRRSNQIVVDEDLCTRRTRGHLQRAWRVRGRCGLCWHARGPKREVERPCRTPFAQRHPPLPRLVIGVRDLDRMRSEGELAKGERRDTTRLAVNHHASTGRRRADEKTAGVGSRYSRLT